MGNEHDDLTAANREAWDAKAKTYDAKPWQQKIAAQVAETLQSHLSWLDAKWSSSGSECRLLDYACGTGSVTRALGNNITHATGIDISPNMLQEYTTLLSSTHPHLSLNTACGDLVSSSPQPTLTSSQFFNFDIAGVALGFHHFSSPETCIFQLSQRLRKDGVVFIVDWLPSSSSSDPQHHHQHGQASKEETEEWQKMKKTIKHNGFTEEDMKVIFEKAGLVDFGFVVLDSPFVLEMNGKEVHKTAFLAKGRKA